MVLVCTHCYKLVSVSMIPGGNPVAKNDPEWSTTHLGCDACGATLCDTCAPEGATVCPKCEGLIEPPPRDPDAPYVYRKPRRDSEWVKPGPGAHDLAMIPIASEEEQLARVRKIVTDCGSEPLLGLQCIYRRLGAPRAWQLGGELALSRLDATDLRVVVGWAKGLLSGAVTDARGEPPRPGQRYFLFPDDSIYHGDFPEPDVSDVELMENFYWPSSMPVEFIESIARLEK